MSNISMPMETKKVEDLTRSGQNVTDGVIGPMATVPKTNDATVELQPYNGIGQRHGLDYTVRDVTGGSADGTYIVLSTSPTAPGGGTFPGGSNPTTGIDADIIAADVVRLVFVV